MTITLAIKQEDWQKVLAEVIGTFFFFFFGIGSIPAALLTGTQTAPTAVNVGFLYIALAHGVALAVAISALGHISGGHFNPAVTVGLAVARKISPMLGLFYIIGQLVGGIAACLALAAILPRSIWAQFALGTPNIAPESIPLLILLETILTFFLVLVVFGTAVDPRANRVAGFGIGLTVFLGIMVAGPLGGGVMNPARALTPAIVSGLWEQGLIAFMIGPLLGGIIAGLLYKLVFLPRGDEPVIAAPQLTDQPLEPPISEPGMLKDSGSGLQATTNE